jgi:hypothetical protein
MDLATFKASLTNAAPPDELTPALQALWHLAKGDWRLAHELAQAQEDRSGNWVHAHLHRVEGDEANAGYWYRRVGRPHSKAPLPQEWDEIVAALLAEDEA